MNEHANPARRVLRLVERVAKGSGKVSTARVWAEALGLDAEVAERDPHEVLTRLNLVRQEIDLAEGLMGETTISPELYVPYFARIRKTVSVQNIGGGWEHYSQNLQADTILALRYCADIVPADPEVSMDELQAVLDKVNALKLEIEGLTLSRTVRDFLLRQLQIIEVGIRDYPIRGGQSIRASFKEGFLDLATHVDSLEKEADKQEASKVAAVWSAFQKAGNKFVETDRIAAAYVNLIGKGHSASQALLGLFGT